MDYLVYIGYRSLEWFFGHLPRPVFYLVSDFLYVFMYRVLGYRKKVVRDNLKSSFPHKTSKEIDKIEKDFFRHLVDIILESLRMPYISEEEIDRIYRITNPEILEPYFSSGRSVMMASSHYANWEWGALVLGRHLKHTVKILYAPIKNKLIDRRIKNLRGKKNIVLVPTTRTPWIFRTSFKGIPEMYAFISDQSPVDMRQAIWIDFLGRRTPCIHGVEKYARRSDLPVFYIDIRKVKRGEYTLSFRHITDHPNELEYGEITKSYMKWLEAQIMEKPEDWLWSHRRWKRAANPNLVTQ